MAESVDSSLLPPIATLPLPQSAAIKRLSTKSLSRNSSGMLQAFSTSADDELLTESEGISSDPVVGNGDILSALLQEKMQVYMTSPDLELLCRENGLSALQFARKTERVTSLDLFMGFWTSMKSVMHFPALKELSIVNQTTICEIEGVNQCTNLESLCITECGLTRIANLANCTKLKHLNLSSNNLQKLENLDTLVNLETLWVNQNKLETLDGLGRVTKLTHLWACRNQISCINSSLMSCVNLKELNLADNNLSSLKGLLSLATMDQLSSLILSDVHFGDNPVCRLCNYETFLVCQLPRLTFLDTLLLPARNKQIAETTMIKKTIYYNMRIKAIKRDMYQLLRHTEIIRKQAEYHMEASVWALVRQKKEIECFMIENKAVSPERIESFEKRLECLNSWLRDRYTTVYRMNQDFERLRVGLQSLSDWNVARLMLELESGGNIRLEDANPSDAWFVSCEELVRSRLYLSGLQKFGIKDIKINRVTRINNRFLRNRFQARMEEVLIVPDTDLKENITKKGVTLSDQNVKEELDCVSAPGKKYGLSHVHLTESPSASTLECTTEYLFYALPSQLNDEVVCKSVSPEYLDIAENGFCKSSNFSATDFGAAIRLSNSIALLDAPRITEALLAQGLQINSTGGSQVSKQASSAEDIQKAVEHAASFGRELPPCVLLVAKVFSGHTKSMSNTDAILAKLASNKRPMDFTGIQSCQVVYGGSAAAIAGEYVTMQQQKLFYMFDGALVLPEYFVEYQYIYKNDGSNPLDSANVTESPCVVLSNKLNVFSGVLAKQLKKFEQKYRVWRSQSPQLPGKRLSSEQDEAVVRLLQMEPILAEVIESPSFTMRLEIARTCHLKTLCLLGCGLDAIPDLMPLANHLEVLILSYNKLQSTSNLMGLSKLITLDLSFNYIARLENFDTLCSLNTLEVTHNLVQSFDEVDRIGQALKNVALEQLDFRKNDICDSKRYRLHVLHFLPKLAQLDQQAVLQEEIATAQSMVTQISSSTVPSFYNKKCHSSKPLPFISDDEKISASSLVKMEWKVVEELYFDHQLLESIEGLSDAINLRVLSLSDNVIKQIDGLQACKRLEEINLDDNKITTIANLDGLMLLKTLSLGRNRLTSIQHLDSLRNLTQLSFEDNQISSLRGLNSSLKLVELYIANNRISNLEEIQHLKSLPRLTILDLSGNEITCIPDYRLYSVFYLRHMKMLDCVAVSAQDESDAREKYSGKLTYELIVEKYFGDCSGTSTDFNKSSISELLDINVSSCQIRDIGHVSGEIFINVRELNLDNNQISNIFGLEALPKLRILKLNRNKIIRLVPAGSSLVCTISDNCSVEGVGILACRNLEILHLAHNQISDMSSLGLQFLKFLKVLHLHGNAIEYLGGLESNTELVELRLDKNRIRHLNPQTSFSLQQLTILNLEDNVLESLSDFSSMLSLNTLELSNNRVTELRDVESLIMLPALVNLNLINNPLTKMHLYRQLVIFKLSSLRILDGKDIDSDERQRIQSYFALEQGAYKAVKAAPEIMMENSTKITTQLILAPSSIPTKAAHSAGISQFCGAANDIGYSRQPPPSYFSQGHVTVAPPFSLSEYEGDFFISKANTNTRSLHPATQNSYDTQTSTESHNSGRQIDLVRPGGIATFSSSQSDTVTSALMSANLSGISLRKQGSNIYHDPQQNDVSLHAKVTDIKLPVGIVSSQAVIRSPNAMMRKAGFNVQPSHAESSFAADSLTTYKGDKLGRNLEGYVVTYGNQKRHYSTPVTTIPQLLLKAQQQTSKRR
ncbi:Protein phosphatase 1, regulatory subunit, and related proteins [Plasmopara halstedii]|uniref:Protein phosphatase 1, regulatory subunit, and related proteins n=1 Tax=Plasmopara halstedii TaxID=4781 RepID=A0A0P1AXP1_PLAHL|nr:Protein phosphatase 1, regulatory subunit, and related proteins [Plasmopara halstedii]CEG45969.1 Protein phosphatase 1, regulatory subunit, and related proteins [Plasmopara halstedii]|eukprot:XP_024582338.1 Protein phosphatase 1, regulatory subunit, and related proteins [Plasmopara halstedii]